MKKISAYVFGLLVILNQTYAEGSGLVKGFEDGYEDAAALTAVILKYVALGAGLLTVAAGMTTAWIWLQKIRGDERVKLGHIIGGILLTLLLAGGFVGTLVASASGAAAQ